MNASIKLGTIRGITIGIHYTWFFVVGLVTYSLAVDFFPAMYSGWSTAIYWTAGLLTSLLLFTSLLAHELGHSFVAQSKGIPVSSITLFIFGGIATITKESPRARDEFEIAIAGPAVSLGIGVLGLLSYALLAGASDFASAVLAYLGVANLLIFGFNLIPAYPLDGGRVFRALVWGMHTNAERATWLAAKAGAGIGILLIIGGVLWLIADPISGIWLAAIGWFIHSAAKQSLQQFRLERSLAGVQVSALMAKDPIIVGPSATLSDVVDQRILGHNARGFPVLADERLIGIITLTDIRDVPRVAWSVRTVQDHMTPSTRLVTTAPDAPVAAVLQAMAERDIQQVPVMRDARLVGLLTRNDVMQFLQLRQETLSPPDTQVGQQTEPAKPVVTLAIRRVEHTR